MKNKNLLIIGAGIDQVPAYERAREMGFGVIGSDINPNAPGFEYSDHRIIASTRAPELLADLVISFSEDVPIHGVMTLGNDVPLTVSTVANRLGLPSSSIETARIAATKSAQIEAFRRHGVPYPETEEISSVDELRRAVSRWGGLPVVVKPPDNRGARGVIRVVNDADIETAFERSVVHSGTGKILVQRFIEGPQISAETCVIDGEIPFIAYSDRKYEFLDVFSQFIIEDGGTIPAQINQDQTRALDEVVRAVARSYGIENGPLKGDLVLSADGPVVLEFANRLGGGFVTSHSIPRSHGVRLLDVVIKQAMGEPIHPDEFVPTMGPVLVQRFFWSGTGLVKKINNFDEIDHDYIVLKQLYVGVGDVVKPPTDHSRRTGFVIVEGDDFECAEQRAYDAVSTVSIETEAIVRDEGEKSTRKDKKCD